MSHFQPPKPGPGPLSPLLETPATKPRDVSRKAGEKQADRLVVSSAGYEVGPTMYQGRGYSIEVCPGNTGSSNNGFPLNVVVHIWLDRAATDSADILNHADARLEMGEKFIVPDGFDYFFYKVTKADTNADVEAETETFQVMLEIVKVPTARMQRKTFIATAQLSPLNVAGPGGTLTCTAVAGNAAGTVIATQANTQSGDFEIFADACVSADEAALNEVTFEILDNASAVLYTYSAPVAPNLPGLKLHWPRVTIDQPAGWTARVKMRGAGTATALYSGAIYTRRVA